MDKFKKWFKALGIKVVKTMSQTAVAFIGTAVALGDVNWLALLSTVALSCVMTVLMNLSQLEEEK